MADTSSRLMFIGGFLLAPPSGWRVEWADDEMGGWLSDDLRRRFSAGVASGWLVMFAPSVAGTLVHLDRPDIHRVWRLTGRREVRGGVVHYEGVWPD